MRNDIADNVCVANDIEIETPATVHPRLPQIIGFVVFLRVKRGVVQGLNQESYLFVECLADGCGRCHIAPHSHRREATVHCALRLTFFFLPLARFTAPWRKAIIASCVSKGPKVRPFLRSSLDSASLALTILRCSVVYSSSADGSFGTILITPPETLNSSRSPVLMPARRRTLRGTTKSVAGLTITVISPSG